MQLNFTKVALIYQIWNFLFVLVACRDIFALGQLRQFHRQRRAITIDLCKQLGCVHGQCLEIKANVVTCKCDPNWVGDLCHIPCNKKCGPYRKCILGPLNKPLCQCKKGGYCGQMPDQPLISAFNLKTISQKTDEKIGMKTASVAVATERPKSILCLPGFTCANGGKCIKDITERGNLSIKCNCAEGWMGDLCKTKCSIKCFNNGRCHRDKLSGNQMCLCPWEYRGGQCEFLNEFMHLIYTMYKQYRDSPMPSTTVKV